MSLTPLSQMALAILVIVVVYFFITRQESFVVNDPDRFLESIEDPENRKRLAKLLKKDTMSQVFDNNYYFSARDTDANKGDFEFLVSSGANPFFIVRSFLHRYDLIDDEYRNDSENLAEELQEGISQEREEALKSRLNITKRNLDNIIEDVKTLLRVYIENRKRVGAKDKYRALTRIDLLVVMQLLLERSILESGVLQKDLLDDIILTDNIHRNKFTIRDQRKYPVIMQYLDNYWLSRKTEIERVLDKELDKEISIPTDVVKMVTKYYNRF